MLHHYYQQFRDGLPFGAPREYVWSASSAIPAPFKSALVRNPAINGWRQPSEYVYRKIPALKLSIDLSYDYSYFQYDRNNGERGFTTGYLEIPIQFPNVSAHRIENSRLRALNKMADEKLHLPLAVAEMHKSVKMVAGFGENILNGFSALKRRDPRAFKYLLNGFDEKRLSKTHSGQKMLNRITSSYLGYKYGIQPLVMDLSGVLRAKRDGVFSHAPLIASKSNQRYVDDFSVSVNLPVQGPQRTTSRINIPYEVVTDVKTSIYATLSDVDYERAGHDLNGLGISLSTAATLAWDLAPFSFVIDHFIPIADIVKSQTAMNGLVHKGATTTTFQHIRLKPGSSKAYGITAPNYGKALPFMVDLSVAQNAGMSRYLVGTHGALPHFVNPIKIGNIATWTALVHKIVGKN